MHPFSREYRYSIYFKYNNILSLLILKKYKKEINNLKNFGF